MSDRTTSLPVGAKRRFLWLAALLAGIHLGGLWIGNGFEPVSVNLAAEPFAELPVTLGPWSGEAMAADPEIFEALGACATLDRVYRHSNGTTVSVHGARWDTLDSWTPHHPEVCYGAAGWKLGERKSLSLKTPNGAACQAMRLAFTRDGQKVHVLYWYQLGPHIFIDRDSARDARRAHWGRDEWPPIEKFMLQTGANGDGTAADDNLRDAAEQVLAWKLAAPAH